MLGKLVPASRKRSRFEICDKGRIVLLGDSVGKNGINKTNEE